jgi:tripartite ATP-independent transporter DctM subunit
MNYSGISTKLMQMAEVLTGHMVGGLAQVNVVLSTMMGGVSGSANADAAMQSKILVPQMEARGYSRSFSSAITAASSAISPVIPPGITMIIYALIAQVSVGKMFAAGYVPGLIMATSLMVTVSIIAHKRGYKPLRDELSWDSDSVYSPPPRPAPWRCWLQCSSVSSSTKNSRVSTSS